MQSQTFEKELILIGGGHSHVQTLRSMAMKGWTAGVRVTLISERSSVFYSGMLPGHLAGLYTREQIQIELRSLACVAGCRFVRARVAGIDPDMRRILFEDRPYMEYDAVSINIGSISRGMEIDGAEEYATPTRPLSRLLTRIDEYEATHAPDGKHPRLVVVGAGAAGVELAFAMSARWTGRYGGVDITLVDSGTEPLSGHHARVRRNALRYLRKKGIRYIPDARVVKVEADRVWMSDGTHCPHDFLLWATGGAAPEMLKNSGLELDHDGFMQVGPTLQTPVHANIFGAGDCIRFADRELPRAGVYAVREGPTLTRNLRAFFEGRPLRPYRPQPTYLALLMTGEPESFASWRFLSPSGRWVWRLKDWIDRRWMDRFAPESLKTMPASRSGEQTPATGNADGETMRCAGCGAKVGSTVLTGVLDQLDTPPNPNVLVGLAEADDAAVLRIPPEMRLIQTVDGFRSFIDDLYLFGRIALIHAASDIYAMGGKPDTALALVTLPHAGKALVAQDLRQLMNGVADEARRSGVTLIGGHTSEGMEAGVGLVINGLIDAAPCFAKNRLAAGDILVLTRPLGVGALLAADMRLRARGEWVDQTLDAMLVSNGPAAEILRRAGVTGVTDVTGFGLAGHLAEMLEASGVGAELELSGLPLLDGVSYCLEQGVRSTLAPSNREHLEKRWTIEKADAAQDEILYDPQTSGGLLAGVPPDRVEELMDALRNAGYSRAAVIGRVIEKRRTLRLIGG